MTRARYFVSRTIQVIIVLWLVLTFLFLLMRTLPGDITSYFIMQGADPETAEAIRARWGFDEPLYIQYFTYIANFVTGDFGDSFVHQKPVVEYVGIRIFNSFILAAPAITLAYIVGSGTGQLMAFTRGSLFEKYGPVPLLVMGTMPSFFFGIVLVMVFAGGVVAWFPSSGLASPSLASEFGSLAWYRIYLTKDFAMHYTLPFLAVFLRQLYMPAFLMRINTIETMGSDFAYYHRITGLSKLKQFTKATKHAMLPVITMYPISMTRALGGLVLIETVFNWPGIGYTLVQSVLVRDYPVVQFVFIVVAAWVVMGNFLIDILYGIIDPRISVGE